jgi:hypothetical protein
MRTTEERLAALEAENAAVRAENARRPLQARDVPRLQAQVEALAAQVQALQARRAKDSHTSRKPPRRDGLRRKTKSVRHRSGKKPGGQLGHRDETWRLVAIPDAVVEPRPAVCAHGQTPLAAAEVVLRERRQLQPRPPIVRLVVCEHQVRQMRWPPGAHVRPGTFPAQASSRAP